MVSQRYSCEHQDLLIFQCGAEEVKTVFKLKGQWMPYKAKLSGQMVTAYVLLETKIWTHRFGDKDFALPLYKGAAIYADTDTRVK